MRHITVRMSASCIMYVLDDLVVSVYSILIALVILVYNLSNTILVFVFSVYCLGVGFKRVGVKRCCSMYMLQFCASIIYLFKFVEI